MATNNNPRVLPLAALDWKEEGDPPHTKIFVQWAGMYPEDATWEPLLEGKAAYPDLHLEDKVFLEAPRDVTTHEEAQDEETHNDTAEEENQEAMDLTPQIRAKRNKLRPKWLKDYES